MLKQVYGRSLSTSFRAFKIVQPRMSAGHLKTEEVQPRIERSVIWDGVEFVSTRENIENGVEWSIQDHRHAIIVHLGGSMRELETELDGQGMSFEPANPGEIWLVPANSRYASRAKGDDIDYGVLFLEPGCLVSTLPGSPTFSRLAPIHGIRDEFCYYAVRQLIDATAHVDDVSTMLAESIQKSLSVYLYRSYGRQSGIEPRANDPVFNRQTMQLLRSYIHDNLSEKITISGMATVTGFPAARFQILFRKAFGQSPGHYIIMQRLRRAQWLLANSAHDITTIAYDTGFSSHSHLTTMFKKYVGTLPSSFRDSWHH